MIIKGSIGTSFKPMEEYWFIQEDLLDLEQLAIREIRNRGSSVDVDSEIGHLYDKGGVNAINGLTLPVSEINVWMRPGFNPDDRVCELIAILPQLNHVQLIGDGVTDVGAAFLARSRSIKHLTLYSRNLTNAGVDSLAMIQGLDCIDIQGSSNVSYEYAVNRLSKIKVKYITGN